MGIKTKKVDIYKKLVEFLQLKENLFLDLWQEQLLLNAEEDKNLVRENGHLMYQFIISAILNEVTEDELQSLAHKVAKERSAATINIGDFVYNVNLGRSIIVKFSYESGIELSVLQPVVDLINRHFDLFCYFALSRYTKLIEQQLQEKKLFITQSHKDRLTILGQMSSSFVHEFRNPLTSVIGFVKLLKKDHPGLPYLDVVSKELDQLKFRITQFLHTSKTNSLAETKRENIEIKHLLEEVLDFLYPSIVDWTIEVTSNIAGENKVTGDRNELKQVFQNLLMNAIDAVSEIEKPRKINIHTKIVNQQINILFSNNGPNLDPDLVHLIFEPFYSTKKLGTGIGLFVCKNIIEKHQGHINCMVSPELTTFQITLPLTEN